MQVKEVSGSLITAVWSFYMLQSSSFKTYLYALAYLAISMMIGYLSVKNISSSSYLFEIIILVIAIILFIKSILEMKKIKANIGTYSLWALNGIIFLGFIIWKEPTMENIGSPVFILLMIVLIMSFITYKVGIRFHAIKKIDS